MPGYEIFERKYLTLHREDGIPPFEIRIGFLDFLREIKSGVEDIPRLSSFSVGGIEEVLYRANPDERQTMARVIHGILQSAASAFERKRIQVQIICKEKLIKGDALWLEYRGERLPIDYVFGSTTTHDVRGIKIFKTGFNLST
jgi:hypothetical protein